ncbi:hypothetical protein HK105_202880 [Polyrhizophydium stewartii]|uniref:Uncharacterized protein n=1 Tax=Polyrhizophydium stewartii TaxID=2732419 RepID=A0ABR4NDP1_9FUNG
MITDVPRTRSLEASPGAGASRKLPVTAEFRKAAAALPLLELERARAAALSDPNASGPSWLALPRETRKPDPALAPPRTSRARRFRSKQAVAELVSRTAPDVSYLSRLAQRRVQHQVRFASRLGMRRADLHNNPRLGSLLHEWNSAPPGSGEPMSSLSKAKSVAVPSSMAEFDQDAFDGSSVLEIRNGREGFRELVKQVADEQLRRQEEYGEKGFRKSAVRIIRRRVIDIAQRFLQKHHAQLRVPNHIPTQQEDPAGVAVVDVLREIYPNFPARQEEPVGARTVAQGLDARHDALQKKFAMSRFELPSNDLLDAIHWAAAELPKAERRVAGKMPPDTLMAVGCLMQEYLRDKFPLAKGCNIGDELGQLAPSFEDICGTLQINGCVC